MKTTYIIWKHERDRYISDRREVVGLFTGTYEEADELLECLNNSDPDVIAASLGRGPLYGYSRSEPDNLNHKNTVDELLNQFHPANR